MKQVLIQLYPAIGIVIFLLISMWLIRNARRKTNMMMIYFEM